MVSRVKSKTTKLSVTVNAYDLAEVKTLALSEGVSVSSLVTKAMRDYINEAERRRVAMEILAEYAPGEFPTESEGQALLKKWSTPRKPPAAKSAAPSRKRRAG